MRDPEPSWSSMYRCPPPGEWVHGPYSCSNRQPAGGALTALPPSFGQMYALLERSSIKPEKLTHALTMQLLYSAYSERLLMERLHYAWLLRRLLGLNMGEPVRVPSAYMENPERL